MLSTSMASDTAVRDELGWLVQDQFARIASVSLEDEVRQSFEAYKSLWKARAMQLASVCSVMSRMSDVRAAFGTGDQATIRDTAARSGRRSPIRRRSSWSLTRAALCSLAWGIRRIEGQHHQSRSKGASRFPEQAADSSSKMASSTRSS